MRRFRYTFAQSRLWDNLGRIRAARGRIEIIDILDTIASNNKIYAILAPFSSYIGDKYNFIDALLVTREAISSDKHLAFDALVKGNLISQTSRNEFVAFNALTAHMIDHGFSEEKAMDVAKTILQFLDRLCSPTINWNEVAREVKDRNSPHSIPDRNLRMAFWEFASKLGVEDPASWFADVHPESAAITPNRPDPLAPIPEIRPPSAPPQWLDLNSKQIASIRRIATESPWEDRDSGDDRTPFEWVRDHYGEFIPGLTMGHLKFDKKLYQAFAQRVSRQGLPEWLDVPSEKEAALRRIRDPREREKLLAVRQWETERSRRRRARKSAATPSVK